MTHQEKTVLKKAGIVVAAAAAALLAVSPLAFAGGSDHGPSSHSNTNGNTSEGLVNVADNNVNVPVQACNNDVPTQIGFLQGQLPISNLTGAASGALALLGKADSSVEQYTDNSRSCGDNSGTAGDSHKQ